MLKMKVNKEEEEKIVYGRQSIAPILKAKQSEKCKDVIKDYKGYHLFILVHGYLGNAEDMSYFKHAISIL
jgi:hypothetical protein